jgi:hypothetical protein
MVIIRSPDWWGKDLVRSLVQVEIILTFPIAPEDHQRQALEMASRAQAQARAHGMPLNVGIPQLPGQTGQYIQRGPSQVSCPDTMYQLLVTKRTPSIAWSTPCPFRCGTSISTESSCLCSQPGHEFARRNDGRITGSDHRAFATQPSIRPFPG